jgi:hypothetical protein
MIILFMSQRFVEKRIYGRVVSISAPRLKVPNSGCTQILMNFELLVPVPVCNGDVCCVLCVVHHPQQGTVLQNTGRQPIPGTGNCYMYR